MLNYILQIIFLLTIIYISYRSKPYLLSNYFIGLILLLYFVDLNFRGESRSLMFEIVMLVYIVPSYTLLFVSSLSIYFDETNSKKYHFFIPVFFYCIILLLELFYFKMKEAFAFIYLPIFMAFFPLYILKYYRKYIKEEEEEE
jgi:hypothetical protein